MSCASFIRLVIKIVNIIQILTNKISDIKREIKVKLSDKISTVHKKYSEERKRRKDERKI